MLDARRARPSSRAIEYESFQGSSLQHRDSEGASKQTSQWLDASRSVDGLLGWVVAGARARLHWRGRRARWCWVWRWWCWWRRNVGRRRWWRHGRDWGRRWWRRWWWNRGRDRRWWRRWHRRRRVHPGRVRGRRWRWDSRRRWGRCPGRICHRGCSVAGAGPGC